ncbi:TonB-dependent receptor domain-containing protein [Sphingomonas colocasiae]|uniref:TonB-dependent receptor n=1 Tax=Sphingomonas colocasiae TaxID=1848973 RepID=A0ABS7PZ32_9SPHN|nr:TonB-dependent receptor [Sphingomonas colocasiae]MBY8825602.1 TonB-dependent receptor [Sphingomonas colocasiae]
MGKSGQLALRLTIGCSATVLALAIGQAPAVAMAQSVRAKTAIQLPAQPLEQSLKDVARRTGVNILFSPALVSGRRASAIDGTMTAEDAVSRLIAGTNLKIIGDGRGGIVLRVRQMGEARAARGAATDPISAGAGQALAAQGDDTAGDIIVTATKSRQRLVDVPASITAETGAQLRRRGATQLQDIVATTPGLSNPGQGSGNGTNLVIRGVTTDRSASLKQSTVSVLFDDIPVDPATAGLEATNLRIVDVERIEVLRGPQGTLFGSGSLSGAVRYITNKPDATRISGSIEGSFAGTKSGADSQWGNAVLNLPLVADRVAVRAVGYAFDEGGWVDNIPFDRRNVNRNRTYGGRIGLLAQATDRLRVTLTGAYQHSRDYAGGESLYFQPAGSDKQVSTNRDSGDSSVKSTIANLGLTYDLGGVSLFSSSTYLHRKVEFLQDFGFYTDLLQLQFGLPALDNATPGRTYNSANIFMQELRVASNGQGPFRWTLGAFYLRSRTPRGGQTVTAPGLLPYLGTDNLIDVSAPGGQEEISGFGEATYSIADTLDLTAGLRVAKTSLDITSTSSGLLVTGSGTDVFVSHAPSDETSVNPRVSLLYRPTGQLSLYAQAARGYRVGGANLTAGLAGPGIPLTYKSDTLWNYEVGIKTSLMDGRLQINADVYYIDWSDLQISLDNNNINYTGNAGAARLYGFEAEVAAKPASWLDLGGSLALNDAALTQDTPNLVRPNGVVGVTAGQRLPASSRVQAAAYAQLNFRIGDDPAYVRASGQYVGPAYSDFASEGIRFGDYGTVDLRAGIVHDAVEITVFVRNLLDGDGKRSASPAFTLGPIFGSAQNAYRVRPRQIGLTGRIDF